MESGSDEQEGPGVAYTHPMAADRGAAPGASKTARAEGAGERGAGGDGGGGESSECYLDKLIARRRERDGATAGRECSAREILEQEFERQLEAAEAGGQRADAGFADECSEWLSSSR
jgi:hypothetical protein